MKLYTEEQVRNALKDAMLRGMRKPSKYESIVELMINDLTPIELPSDEDIEKIVICSNLELGYDFSMNSGFKKGAKWMRNKIQGGTQKTKNYE